MAAIFNWVATDTTIAFLELSPIGIYASVRLPSVLCLWQRIPYPRQILARQSGCMGFLSDVNGDYSSD